MTGFGACQFMRRRICVPAFAVALVDRTISYLSIIVTGGTALLLRQVGLARRATAGAGTA